MKRIVVCGIAAALLAERLAHWQAAKVVLDPVTGFMNGEGTIAFVNGDRYEGGIVDNRKQGRGTFIWPNGQRYEGEWVNDTINGHGKFFYTNGDRYEAQIAADRQQDAPYR